MATVRNDMSFETPIINHLDFTVKKDSTDETFLDSGDIQLEVENQVLKKDDSDEIITNTCKTIVRLTVGENKTEFPFVVRLEMESVFHWDNDIDMDMDSYVRFHTPAIVYSYMRPIVTDLVTKSGFPPFNLPFMNFSEENINKDK